MATAQAEETITLKKSELDKMLTDKMQEFFTKLGIASLSQARNDESPRVFKTPDSVRDGEIIPPGWIAPEGWQAIVYQDGTQRAHRRGKKNFVMDQRTRMLKQVDAAFKAWFIKTPEAPDPKPPAQMLINKAFYKLFPNVSMWGDHTKIVRAKSDTFKGKDGNVIDGPAFRFASEPEPETEID